ncbi:MAG: glutamine-hydrolyzing GMP synthase [Bdellovibrio sp. CG12_big_fil_rev_8_21_14_0_65_39_13]|nr:MAG: glutamine-hydrolyzing GMP synthase [Bdellovibrio sp. CG22_combo_CG10-13_8_21_14_all_39_27]PIQ59276.1 MAG: glutamine-hydrolyzing GMP synthase [Bdellovibrio sp. CG12_big_fil_rev_8_21_14_0_65_39_13]PIR32287.1 MAG: glutamine-hydrolyzing GMP synthase [Bdellovibrio sp. CG11_big_fil_rev_8_21_14_0_20_39_38]PJB54552.1 MAG: glutamine-hydrolyzing GMP synthase [Bdellovibrio sp. CG_4_9_14_3_um_filter_39_7]
MIDRQIWIIDFGSQYTQLITRKTRELGHSSVIMTVEESRDLINQGHKPECIVLSGGPQSVFEDKEDYSFVFELNLPLLGICYGMQLMGQYFGGKVEKGVIGEYGHTKVKLKDGQSIANCPPEISVWMSHFDHVSVVPQGFEIVMESHNKLVATIVNKSKKLMGLQFHPEVEHSEHGKDILKHFYSVIAGLKEDWDAGEMLKEANELVKSVGKDYVLCAFSGGVDSLVAATIAHHVIGKNLHCFFVDNGLLRPQDYGHIQVLKNQTDLNIEIIDAKEIFYKNLSGIDDPEQKRKIIGRTFIEVFETKVHEYERDHAIKFTYLLQGTLYPDVIESTSPHKKGGKSVTIKSHHNVGGLPERMNLKLLEPLRFLFKDEGRTIGMELGLKHEWVYRHPFPGPGIGVRVLGELFPDSIRKVQESDQILFEELLEMNLYESVAQAFTVLLPVKTVGVKGDGRAYEEVICLRVVSTSDFMTATWSDLSYAFLSKVSNRITNEVRGITRVVYDITSKPPGTIEWE